MSPRPSVGGARCTLRRVARALQRLKTVRDELRGAAPPEWSAALAEVRELRCDVDASLAGVDAARLERLRRSVVARRRRRAARRSRPARAPSVELSTQHPPTQGPSAAALAAPRAARNATALLAALQRLRLARAAPRRLPPPAPHPALERLRVVWGAKLAEWEAGGEGDEGGGWRGALGLAGAPAAHSLPRFLQLRRKWDAYCAAGAGGSAVPAGWVLPGRTPAWRPYRL